ncbi:unnamed protein product [Nyctereutes procyonoides]|uniref:(raccoon dog) hypothetical protein n=1 Tax=Nyctereutes procyonoides TaxID=34880 RepID=A0A811ZRW9_NYCPR|nr:unnamed protein product [Nyctereutes procyonoides]
MVVVGNQLWNLIKKRLTSHEVNPLHHHLIKLLCCPKQCPGRFRLEQYSVRSGFRQPWRFSLFPTGRRGRCWAELPASRREGRRRTDGPLGGGDHVSDLTRGWIQTCFRTQALWLQRLHLGTEHVSGRSSQRQCSGFEIQSGTARSAQTPVAVTSVNAQRLEREGGSARAETCTTPYFALASPSPSRKATRSCICRRISLASSPRRAERPCAAHRASPALGGGRSARAADRRAAQPLAAPLAGLGRERGERREAGAAVRGRGGAGRAGRPGCAGGDDFAGILLAEFAGGLSPSRLPRGSAREGVGAALPRSRFIISLSNERQTPRPAAPAASPLLPARGYLA